MSGHPRVRRELFAEPDSRFMCGHGDFIDDLVRSLLSDLRSEGEHHPLREQQASQHVRIGLHSLEIGLEVLDDGAHPRKERAAIDHELGDRGELHPERRGIALVLLEERIGEGDDEPAHETPERHRELGTRGVSLVRHRAASDFPQVEWLMHLIDLGPLQIIDFVGDFSKGARALNQQPGNFGNPIAGRMPADPGGAEPEAIERAPLHLVPARAEGRHRADRAGDVADEDAGLGLREPVEVPVDLVHPDRELVAERDGKGVLAVGAPHHEGVAVGAGFGREPLPDGAEVREEQRPRFAHQEDHAGVHDVLGGGPIVDVLAGVAVAQGGEGPDGGYERMGGGGDLAADRVEVHERRVRLAGDLLRRVLGNDAELPLR